MKVCIIYASVLSWYQNTSRWDFPFNSCVITELKGIFCTNYIGFLNYVKLSLFNQNSFINPVSSGHLNGAGFNLRNVKILEDNADLSFVKHHESMKETKI